MALENAHRFSVEDYYRMAETGVIPRDARVELLDGQIVDMGPIGPLHAGTVITLNKLFCSLSKSRWLNSAQNPLRLGPHSEPQPDLVLLKPEASNYRRRHPEAADVILLIEVADNTVDFDRKVKLPLYGQAGVPEVGLINLPEQRLEIYRSPHFNGYSETLTLRSGDKARLQAFPDLVISVDTLLGTGQA